MITFVHTQISTKQQVRAVWANLRTELEKVSIRTKKSGAATATA